MKGWKPVSEEQRAQIRALVEAGAAKADEQARRNGSWRPDWTAEEARQWACEHGVDFREPPS